MTGVDGSFAADDAQADTGAASPGARGLGPELREFFTAWHGRQRATLGVLATLCSRIDALSRAHPEWAGYDLRSYLLAAWWLVIDNDRLIGGRSRELIEAQLAALAAAEQPSDDPQRHRQVAQAVLDVLTNDRERHTQFQDTYLHIDEDGAASHLKMSFAMVRYARAQEEDAEPLLQPSLMAVNVFQALYAFDPADRVAAERFRSERMLERQDYQEVQSSVLRRATSVREQRAALDLLLARMNSNVSAVSYSLQAIPALEDTLALIEEQAQAEDRFAQAVAERTANDAPDIARLQAITSMLNSLIASLNDLYCRAADVKSTFEHEQDRQLFTAHAVTVGPQPDLFEPLMDLPAHAVCDALEPLLAALLGPRTPRVTNLLALMERAAGHPRRPGGRRRANPLDLGPVIAQPDDIDPRVLAALDQALSGVDCVTSLSELLPAAAGLGYSAGLTAAQLRSLEWILAITVTNGFANDDDGSAAALIERHRLLVCRAGEQTRTGRVSGDDLVLVPLLAERGGEG